MSEYNYTSFPLDMEMPDFERFPEVSRAGSKAPDGELVDARSGETVRLSALWRKGPLILEFGSIT